MEKSEWFFVEQKMNALLAGKVIKRTWASSEGLTIETTDGCTVVYKPDIEAKVVVTPNAELFDQNGRVE